MSALVFSAPAAAGPKVAAVQVALKRLGLYSATVDGVRGPLTKAAIVHFQRRRGLAVDGVVGPRTRAAFGKRGRPAFGSRTMKRGDRGWDIAAMQYILARRGYPPGAIDAVFGPMTDTALRNFQRAYGLGADGLAGPMTISALRHGRASRGTPGSTTPVSGPVRLLRPVPGPIGDGFGAPREGKRTHTGIDFPVTSGTRIGAAGVGVVEFAGWNTGGYGNLVVVRHRLGYTTWYAHMSRIAVSAGQSVTGGTHSATSARPATRPAPTSTSSCAATRCRSTRCRTCWRRWRRGRAARAPAAARLRAARSGRRGTAAVRVAVLPAAAVTPEAASPRASARSERRSSVTGEHRSTPARRRTSHAPANRGPPRPDWCRR